MVPDPTQSPRGSGDKRQATAIDRIVGQNLRDRRMQLRLSQTAVAQALGISYQQVQKYERGFNRISAGLLFEVAVFLGMDIEDAFSGATLNHVDIQPHPAAGNFATPPQSAKANNLADLENPELEQGVRALLGSIIRSGHYRKGKGED